MIGELWQIGDVKIRRIVEIELTGASGIMTRLIPDATPELLAEMVWLVPHFVDAQGRMVGSVHALVVETPECTIVVDTCVGNDKPRTNPDFNLRQSDFLDDLSQAGYTERSIDTVLCTHLHVDHVGWNTVLRDGHWVPTFPDARYLFGEAEYHHWCRTDHGALARLDVEAVIADSVQPVFDAGLVDLVLTEHRICSEVRLTPTPGHTPGHVSVVIESQGDLGTNREHAERVSRGPLMYKYEAYASWGQTDTAATDFADQFEDFAADRFVLGDEPYVRDTLQRYAETCGTDHFLVRVHWPGLEQSEALGNIERIGNLVGKLK